MAEECIKDKKRFTPEELQAITSQDYNRRKILSASDVLTIRALYSTGEVMHKRGGGTLVYSSQSTSLVTRLSRSPRAKDSLAFFKGILGCAESACSENG